MAIRALDPARLISEWGSFANAEYEQARKREDDTAMRYWSAGGACRAACHAVIGGVLGGSGAVIGAGLLGEAMVPIRCMTTHGAEQPSLQIALESRRSLCHPGMVCTGN